MSNKLSDVHLQIADVARNYHYHEPIPWLVYLRDLAATALRWLWDWISSLFAIIPIQADTRLVGNTIKLVLLVLGGLSILLILYLAWSKFRDIAKQAALAKTIPLSIDGPFNSQDWFNEAIESSKASRWKEACRALYMSCLRLLDEREILSFVPTRTNFEVWYALSKYQNLAKIFRPLADRVDTLWFGTKLAEERDFLSSLSSLKDIRVEVATITSERDADEQNTHRVGTAK
jgi:hypothetical protein